MLRWIDSHCHLDAPEFAADRAAVRARATQAGVAHCVIPAVVPSAFDAVAALAQQYGDSYALGLHPLYIESLPEDALTHLDSALRQRVADARLLAVGEIGLDFFVPTLQTDALRQRQEALYQAQLGLARAYGLPVILHVRRSADRLLKALRAKPVAGGIAHAFNGSLQQAHGFLDLGFKLGFGGALSFERALQLRRLAQQLPLDALVLETDAPDIPPHWLYRPASERAAGQAQGRNEPAQLPRIAAVLAQCRGIELAQLANACWANTCAALPRLGALLADQAGATQAKTNPLRAMPAGA